MNQLHNNFVNITQLAAASAFPLLGKGDEHMADQLATETLRKELNKLDVDGTIKIGEGEMDDAPMLFIGEKVGTGKGEKVDIAVDPIDGTSLVAENKPNAITVLAISKDGGLLHAPDMYMKKIAVGPSAADVIDIKETITTNITDVAKAKNKEIDEMVVTVQKRERHAKLIEEIEHLGATVQLFDEVDVTAALSTCIEESGIDIFVGIGGAPEGVISAAGIKALRGGFQAQLLPHNEMEYNRCLAMGLSEPKAILQINDIVKTENVAFYASGITDGLLLKGLSLTEHGIDVHSISIDSKTNSYSFYQTTIKNNEGDGSIV